VNAETCPVCGSPPADACAISGPDRLHGVPGTFCVAVCSECSGGWTLPHADESELGAFYPDTYGAYVLEHGFLGAIQRAGQRVLMDFAVSRPPLDTLTKRPPGALLDVGCGRGDLGAALVRHGWRVSGIDPSPAACDLARSRGVDAHVGTLASVTLSPESFDAVVMTHALEHVAEPRVDLARIRDLLRPGGVVVISVPNFGSWQQRRFDTDWFPLELPRHRTHFTATSLATALRSVGFESVSVRSGSDNGFALLASLQYRHAGRLVVTRGPAAWAMYAFSPVNRLVDRTRGNGALLHAVARRR
jgi:SAM-dependent methyltransferase